MSREITVEKMENILRQMLSQGMDGEQALERTLTMCFDCMVTVAGGIRLGRVSI